MDRCTRGRWLRCLMDATVQLKCRYWKTLQLWHSAMLSRHRKYMRRYDKTSDEFTRCINIFARLFLFLKQYHPGSVLHLQNRLYLSVVVVVPDMIYKNRKLDQFSQCVCMCKGIEWSYWSSAISSHFFVSRRSQKVQSFASDCTSWHWHW